MPADAHSPHLHLKKSRWGHGGCDGGPPGRTNMKANETFHAAGHVIAEIDAKMRRLHFRVVPRFHSKHSGQYPPPASPGRSAPYIREYRSSAPGRPFAWLYTPLVAGGTLWALDLSIRTTSAAP